MKILAVDDDESICALLTEAVSTKTKHHIVTAASGPEAIRTIAKAKIPFDCFLLDIQMPIMDGITLVHRIRKTKGHARTPILMLTATSQKKYIDAAFAAGATDFVTKPFDFLELFSRISIAGRLVSEHKRVAEKSWEMVSLKRDLMHNTSHSLTEPVELMGVTQVLGYVSFEDHLLSLSRTELKSKAAFATKVKGIETAYKTLPPVSFRHFLTDLSSELMSVVADNDAVATYRGNGLFLCLVPNKRQLSHKRIEAEMNDRLAYIPSTQMDGLQCRVSVGEPQKLHSWRGTGALVAVQKATLNAEIRARSENTGVASLRKAVRLHPGSGFQTEMERRAYENLLQDTLKDDSEMRPTMAAFG
ncbi:hypothetical protein NBRC116594_08210 [Shimia sp. NS0008-38b]|uniref:response regulator n=1 Tax=Shimia sp. NS0008-38b TaxID=3127653 RepID=UPI00310C846B